MPLPIIAGGAAAAFVINLLRILLMAKLGAMIASILLFFGLVWGTNKFAIGPAFDFLQNHMASLSGVGGEYGAVMFAWLGVLRFDQAVTMVLSAYTAAWTIKSAKVFLMRQP